jgi:dCTP deaminase
MLTGNEIARQVSLGRIKIEPFVTENLQPNSIDVRLGDVMEVVVPNNISLIDTNIHSKTEQVPCIDGVFILQPNRVYLGLTMESVWSDTFVPMLHGRSSVARHGLAIHVSAGFGDLGWRGRFVLELINFNPYPLLIKPGVRIGQISFDRAEGEVALYNSTYQNQQTIMSAKELT